jgi:hypothetical protein
MPLGARGHAQDCESQRPIRAIRDRFGVSATGFRGLRKKNFLIVNAARSLTPQVLEKRMQ